MNEAVAASGRTVVGAVDVGSNTIKLTVGRLGANGAIEEMTSAADTVRLGLGSGASGRLAEDRIEAALAVLRDYATSARDLGATRLVGVATEATRKAANGEEFLQRVRAETGWDVRLIDGDEEAALTFRGVASRGGLHGLVVIADIGGASTELIVASDNVVTSARSIAIGSGTLTDRFVVADPPGIDEMADCTGTAESILNTALLPLDAPARLIAVGGTAEYMAQLVSDDSLVSFAEIEHAIVMCQAQPSDVLASTLAIPQARARVLPAGILVIRALMTMLDSRQVEIAPSGIRTGLLLETFAAIGLSDSMQVPEAI